MTMKCFKCKNFFSNSVDLIKHFKTWHSDLMYYKCAQSHCFRYYSQLKSFEHHLKEEHVNLTIFEKHETPKTFSSKDVVCNGNIKKMFENFEPEKSASKMQTMQVQV